MAKLILDYYNGSDIYNDGDVEQLLLNHYKDNSDLDYQSEGVFYLTTSVRSNIINWFPFEKTDEVLEIGCGCGTITKVLTDKCANVVCVEGSKRRAEITYYRNQDKDNLEVYAGNFDDVKIKKKFDYVILIGVFEYAKLFFESKTPFDDFLNKIKNVLKDTGKVLIAIENRYGIKYWAGADEDHIREKYVGLTGYDKYKIQTFGKKEFVDMIKRCGFSKYKFYYPFPDYKLPSVIYTDDRVPSKSEIDMIPIYPYGSTISFNVRDVLKGLVDNDSFGFFSNSYMVEFGFDKAEMSDVIYARMPVNRKEDYKTITVQNKNDFYKLPSNELAANHLEQYINVHKLLKQENIKTCDIHKKDDKYIIEKVDGELFVDHLLRSVYSYDLEKFDVEIDKLVEFYHSISRYDYIKNPIIQGLKQSYKDRTHILKLSIIDGNCSNIIVNNNDYYLIDQEWLAEGELPADYLIYFSLVHIFAFNIGEYLDVSLEKYLKKYNINKKKVDLFNSIEEKYYKTDLNVKDDYATNILDMCSSSNSGAVMPNYYSAVVYYDTGKGFNENEKIFKMYDNYDYENELYELKCELPKNVKQVRFDPVAMGNKFLSFSNIKINDKKVKYEEYNIEEFDGNKALTMEHPFIMFKHNKSKLNIKIKIIPFSDEECKKYIDDYNKTKENLDNIEKEYKKVKEDVKALSDSLNSIVNSRGWKILEKIKKIKNK